MARELSGQVVTSKCIPRTLGDDLDRAVELLRPSSTEDGSRGPGTRASAASDRVTRHPSQGHARADAPLQRRPVDAVSNPPRRSSGSKCRSVTCQARDPVLFPSNATRGAAVFPHHARGALGDTVHGGGFGRYVETPSTDPFLSSEVAPQAMYEVRDSTGKICLSFTSDRLPLPYEARFQSP